VSTAANTNNHLFSTNPTVWNSLLQVWQAVLTLPESPEDTNTNTVKYVSSGVGLLSAFTLLVGRQEEHPACKTCNQLLETLLSGS